jgi:lipopolysaccharide export system protein LptA
MPDRDCYIRFIGSTASRLLLALCLAPAVVHALPDDRDQPIHITADKALRDEKQGVTVYSGNVVLIQGSMKLEAATLTIYHTSENAEKIVAEGNPAKMQQQPELDKAVVHAHGKVVTYFRSEAKVHLQTDASIEQDGAVVAGDSIDYFIDKQVITAESDQTQKGDKVKVVIPPSMQQKEGRSGATNSE